MELKKLVSIILVICMTVFVTYAGIIDKVANTDSDSSFWVEFIDVGQGDSALLQCDGHYMLIDGGNASASSIIYSILKSKKISEIDYMIATHPDKDHIGGLSGALNYAKVGKFLCPLTEYDTKPFNNMIKYLEEQGSEITVPRCGDSFPFGSAKVEILGPITETSNNNNMSIVVRIVYGKTSFLFMGDAEEDEEYDLMNSHVKLSADVVKIAHHGSSHSSSEAFLSQVKPKYAVISVGANNTYGHPTIDTLNRLKNVGASVFRTDLQGDIVCTSDGREITFTTEKDVDESALWMDRFAGYTDPEMSRGIISTYVLNIHTYKFHLPDCPSVSNMKEENRKEVTMTREELIEQGYSPCGNCHP